ncbi:hypothetical protein GCM10011413_35330 [Pedobacter psychrotolerans]|nr:hypothetical protein GCM10011413_35330 [Pedobacter psychrotolerans]
MLMMFITSCSKSNYQPGNSNSYPKDVNVEYRITAISGVNSGDVLYANASGGNTSVDNVSLPYSVKFKRTVKQLDNLVLGYSKIGSGEVKVEILVNDQVVETKSFSSTSYVTGTIVYLFQ